MSGIASVVHFARNVRGSDWVVGDLHGCFATLDLLLEEIGFDTGCDRLFSVGDLADRGPESERALEFLDYPWFHAVRGNHEQFLLDSLEDADTRLAWLMNGGGWFSRQPMDVREAFQDAFSRLPYLMEVETGTGTVGVVHADVPPGVAWPRVREGVERQDMETLDTLLWGRHRAILGQGTPVEGIHHVFCGHTPLRPSVRIVGNVHFIDQGAVFGLRHGIPESGLTVVSIDGNRVRTREAVWPPDFRATEELGGGW